MELPKNGIDIKDGEEVAPGILVFNNVISDCKNIIENLNSQDNLWNGATVGNGSTDSRVEKDIRDCSVLYLKPKYSNPSWWFLVNQLLWTYGRVYSNHFNAAFSEMESAQVLHYRSGENFYKPHTDDGPGYNREFSAVLYLNNVEEGGETYFPNFDFISKPLEGKLIMFPANFTYLHEARPPLSSDKYCIVTWYRRLTLDNSCSCGEKH